MSAAPIAVFAYRRAALLERALAALAACEGFAGSRVHVFCDAPADAAVQAEVDATRAVADAWCRRHGARRVDRDANLGLRNVTDGVSELCAGHGRALSLEEDHVATPGFLVFLDRALQRYADDERVFQATGFLMGLELPGGAEAVFLPLPMPVGWGTWERAWRHFRWDVAPLAATVLADPRRRRSFDLDGAYPASALLERALAGRFDSYFIRWYLTVFAHAGLVLCPRRSLVWNHGATSGLHGRPGGPALARLQRLMPGGPAKPETGPGEQAPGAAQRDGWSFPAAVEVDAAAFARVKRFLRQRDQG